MAMTDAEQAGIKVESIPENFSLDETDPLLVSDVGVARQAPSIPTLRGKPIEQYDLNLDEFYRVTADKLGEAGKRNDLPAVTNELVKSLIAKAKTDPQFEGINWNKFSQQDPNKIVRYLVKNVRPESESFGDTVGYGLEDYSRGLAKGVPSFYAGFKTGSAAFTAMPGGPVPKTIAGITGFLTGSGLTALAYDALEETFFPADQVAPEDRRTRNIMRSAGELSGGLQYRSLVKGGELASEATMAALADKAKILRQGKGAFNRLQRITTGSQRVTGKVLQFAERINKAVAKDRTKLMGTEAGAITSAAILGALADEAKPGDPLYRLGGELTGGFGFSLIPGKWIVSTILKAPGAVKGQVQTIFSETARQEKAVGRAMEDVGRDIMERAPDGETITAEEALKIFDDELIKIKERIDIAEQEGRVVGTLGQVTDQPALQLITKKVMQNNAGLGEQARASADALILKQIELIQAYFMEGSPNSVKLALQLQEEFYGNMINTLVAQESWKAVERINNLTAPVVKGGVRRYDTGQIIAETLQRVTRLGREQEGKLWDAVPKEIPASGSNTSRVVQEILSSEYNEGDALPVFLKGYAQQLAEEMGTAATPEVTAAQQTIGKISNNIDNLLTKSPNALNAYDEALDNLKTKNLRTLNLGLEDFDPAKSEAAQVFEYLSRRLARLGQRGVSPAERRQLEAASKLAELRVAKENATAQLSALVPEGGQLPNATTTGELITYRKQLINTAFNESADSTKRGQASKIARAVLEDLGEVGVDDLAYESARSYSRAFNDKFTRSVIGDIIGFGQKIKLQPEQVTPKIIRANDVATEVNARQIPEALRFIAERNPEYSDLMTSELRTLNEQYDAYLRILIGGYTDENGIRVGGILNEDGSVNAGKLENFTKQRGFQPILENLPGLRSELKDAVSAQRLVDSMVKGQTDDVKNLADQKAFIAEVTKWEGTPDAIYGVIGIPGKRTPTAAADFERLVQFITKRNAVNETVDQNIVNQQRRVDQARAILRDARKNPEIGSVAIKQYEDDLASKQNVLDNLLEGRAKAIDAPVTTVLDDTTPLPVLGPEKPGGVLVADGREIPPRDLVNGMKETVLEAAFNYSRSSEGDKTKFNPFKFESYLFEPIASGKRSVAEILNANGALSGKEIAHLKEIVETIKKSAGKSMYLGEVPELVEISNDSLGALARLVGVKISDLVAPVSSMGQLQSANIFSNMMHKVIIKMPAHRQEMLFTRMSKDPKFFLQLVEEFGDVVRPIVQKNLEKDKFDQAVEATTDFLARSLGVRISNAAIRQAVAESFSGTLEQSVQDVQRQKRVEQRTAPAPTPAPAPRSTQPPVQSISTPPAPPVAAPQASATIPQTRQRVSQLFPNDPILGSNSGIGSLLG